MRSLLIILLVATAAQAQNPCTVFVPAVSDVPSTEAELELDLRQRLVRRLGRQQFRQVGHPADAHYVVSSYGVSCNGVRRIFSDTYCRAERQAHIIIDNARTGAMTIVDGRSRLTVRTAFEQALRDIPRCDPRYLSLRRP
jgi:hypothetical protein